MNRSTIFVALGGVLMVIGAMVRATQSLWSQPWFDAGIGFVVLGLAILCGALRHYYAEQGKSLSRAVVLVWRALRAAPKTARNWSPIVVHITRRGFPPRDSVLATETINGIRIDFAAYGPEDRIDRTEGIDVSERIRDLTRAERFSFVADNETLIGDDSAYPGTLKSLHLRWRRERDGVVATNTYAEHTTVDLDP